MVQTLIQTIKEKDQQIKNLEFKHDPKQKADVTLLKSEIYHLGKQLIEMRLRNNQLEAERRINITNVNNQLNI